jgi:hypothetical protein
MGSAAASHFISEMPDFDAKLLQGNGDDLDPSDSLGIPWRRRLVDQRNQRGDTGDILVSPLTILPILLGYNEGDFFGNTQDYLIVTCGYPIVRQAKWIISVS